MLLLSCSVGVIAGLFIATVRLNLGMPGHKAFLWMTPVLIARLRGGCKIGTTMGGLFAAVTAYSLGSNLAGGIIGMPMIALAGAILDWTVNFIEKNKVSGLKMILTLALAGLIANLVCLAKRMILPTGISPHHLFGLSTFWFKLLSYAFFGLLSGITAAIITKPNKT
jgi:riboflavin transporter FmnP